MRYWLYKNNSAEGGPAGYRGDWLGEVFQDDTVKGWGGHYSSASPVVWRLLSEDVSVGDVVLAYQSDSQEVVGFCVVDDLTGPNDNVELQLRPVERIAPLKIHKAKKGTPLEGSAALKSRYMLSELTAAEMGDICSLTGADRSKMGL